MPLDTARLRSVPPAIARRALTGAILLFAAASVYLHLRLGEPVVLELDGYAVGLHAAGLLCVYLATLASLTYEAVRATGRTGLFGLAGAVLVPTGVLVALAVAAFDGARSLLLVAIVAAFVGTGSGEGPLSVVDPGLQAVSVSLAPAFRYASIFGIPMPVLFVVGAKTATSVGIHLVTALVGTVAFVVARVHGRHDGSGSLR